jgi:UDP-2-acetamido-3-amino-2,3-dideoxy-glucuronate N-acetyltransferase
MVGSGSVITRDIPAYGLVMGNPARLRGFVCPCGEKMEKKADSENGMVMGCSQCDFEVIIPRENFQISSRKEVVA